MSRAVRRDHWDRFGQLITVVYNRTIFGEKDKPISVLDAIPKDLITVADRLAEKRAKNAGKVKIGVLEMAGLMGVEVPMPTFDELYPSENE